MPATTCVLTERISASSSSVASLSASCHRSLLGSEHIRSAGSASDSYTISVRSPAARQILRPPARGRRSLVVAESYSHLCQRKFSTRGPACKVCARCACRPHQERFVVPTDRSERQSEEGQGAALPEGARCKPASDRAVSRKFSNVLRTGGLVASKRQALDSEMWPAWRVHG